MVSCQERGCVSKVPISRGSMPKYCGYNMHCVAIDFLYFLFKCTGDAPKLYLHELLDGCDVVLPTLPKPKRVSV